MGRWYTNAEETQNSDYRCPRGGFHMEEMPIGKTVLGNSG